MWKFIQDQILGMKWLSSLIGRLLTAAGLDVNTRIGGSVQFFLYDVIKITVLLCVLIFLISYIQSFFPPERSRKIMGRFHGVGANIVGALLGTVTPFCSCSSIPIFMGFTSAGLPLGVTFSFLISSPMVDLGSLVLLMSIFGLKIAIAYVILGLVIAVIGGTLIEKLHMEDQIADFIRNSNSSVNIEAPDLTAKDRLIYAKDQVTSTFKKVFPYIMIGVGIGALIHNWIPESWIQTILGSSNPFGVILATGIGVPMYADIFGTIPVAEALLAKGALLGTILSFIMTLWIGRKNDLKLLPRASWGERWKAFKEAFWGLLMPVIILGGIYGGIFTPTEAAAVSAVYGLIVGIFVYKTLKLKDLKKIIIDSASTTAVVMLITAAASLFAYVLTRARINVAISSALENFAAGNTVVFLIIVNICLLIAGCFLDSTSALYIFTPLFLPVAQALGMNLVHFGTIMIVNLAIGLVTPPVGVNLYVACGIAKVDLKAISKAVIPLIIASLIVLLLVTYIPQISLLLLGGG